MSADRGQTTFDFAVGMSVFLGVLVFAFAFVPTMFAPFESGTGPEFIVADRAADRLSGDALVEAPREASNLDDGCTVEFFDGDGTAPASCRYGTDASNLSAALGIDDDVGVNVTVHNDSGIRTLGGTRLAAGRAPTSVDDTVVATRSVLLAGDQHRLFVRVW